MWGGVGWVGGRGGELISSMAMMRRDVMITKSRNPSIYTKKKPKKKEMCAFFFIINFAALICFIPLDHNTLLEKHIYTITKIWTCN